MAAFCALATTIWSDPALSLGSDVFSATVGGSTTYDSNVFRRPAAVGTQSDIIATGFVGLQIDKPISLQRFQLGVTETATRYDTLSYLDFNATAYRAAWLWSLTPRISGTLSADRTESLAPFEATLGTQRNVRRTDSRVFNVDAQLGGGGHLLLGLTKSKQTSEQAFQFEPDFESVGREIGIRYRTVYGSSVTATWTSTIGDSLNTVFDPANTGNDGYREDRGELEVEWPVSEPSTLTGRIGWIDRRHDRFPERDFSGLTLDMGYVWTPTAKLSLAVSAGRNVNPYLDAFSRYVVDSRFSVAPTWRATEKISVRADVNRLQSDYRGGAIARPGGPRRDVAHGFLLGADWSPRRNVTAGVSLQHQRRTSNELLASFNATIFGVNATIGF